jgi:enoyl-CoA hydratase
MSDRDDAALVRSWSADGVGRVHLDHADQRNALSPAMSDQLAGAVRAVLADDVGAIVLTAAAPVFCSGGSLDALLSRDVPLEDSYAGMQALAQCPVPTIAAVDGPAIGAGCNLPLACDVILASPAARFDPRFLDVAIHPGGGHLWRLAQRIGPQGAAALVLCGDVLGGEEAAAVGLVWRCVAADELEETALRMARRAAGRSRPLVIRTKQSLRATALSADGDAAAALELQAQQWSVGQPEFEAAVRQIQARLAGRSPQR